MPIYIAGESPAMVFAAQTLREQGVMVISDPAQADCWLYDVPTPAFTLEDAPRQTTVIGGNLAHLADPGRGIDLLADPWYLAQNARITAQAALGLLLPRLEDSFDQCPTLLLGWGRIGKCLEGLLRQLGFPVWVYARKTEDRAMLTALGGNAVTGAELETLLPGLRCIINTAPAQILTAQQQQSLSPECIRMELASIPGLLGPNVLHARGLPGKYRPRASGRLIAQSILRHQEVL